eukprot:c24538_g1_i1 orf=326-787(-)
MLKRQLGSMSLVKVHRGSFFYVVMHPASSILLQSRKRKLQDTESSHDLQQDVSSRKRSELKAEELSQDAQLRWRQRSSSTSVAYPASYPWCPLSRAMAIASSSSPHSATQETCLRGDDDIRSRAVDREQWKWCNIITLLCKLWHSQGIGMDFH